MFFSCSSFSTNLFSAFFPKKCRILFPEVTIRGTQVYCGEQHMKASTQVILLMHFTSFNVALVVQAELLSFGSSESIKCKTITHSVSPGQRIFTTSFDK